MLFAGVNKSQKVSFVLENGLRSGGNKYGTTFLQKFLVTTICSATVADAPQGNGVFGLDPAVESQGKRAGKSRFGRSFSLG